MVDIEVDEVADKVINMALDMEDDNLQLDRPDYHPSMQKHPWIFVFNIWKAFGKWNEMETKTGQIEDDGCPRGPTSETECSVFSQKSFQPLSKLLKLPKLLFYLHKNYKSMF